MCQEGMTFDRTQFLIEEWKTVIETQIHFNEMIIRARTTGVSVVMAVYGAAALSIGQYPGKFINIFGSQFHVSAAIILFGISLLAGIFCMDYLYYYRLLLGAVERGEQIDKAYQGYTIGATVLFGMTTLISKKISRRRATACLIIFYGIPLVVGILSLIYLTCFYCVEVPGRV
jgi:drug/metabolite transporter (DMT)-like permease